METDIQRPLFGRIRIATCGDGGKRKAGSFSFAPTRVVPWFVQRGTKQGIRIPFHMSMSSGGGHPVGPGSTSTTYISILGPLLKSKGKSLVYPKVHIKSTLDLPPESYYLIGSAHRPQMKIPDPPLYECCSPKWSQERKSSVREHGRHPHTRAQTCI